MATTTQVSALQVAQEVKNQGGSNAQGWVAAALVSGIESNGQPTDKNPSSTACGLFQFLTTTWLSNGGGQFAPTACAAPWQDQVTVFLRASNGSNFYPWAPDLGGSYNGNTSQGAATIPQPGSAVANKIASLQNNADLAKLLGSPQNWGNTAGGVVRANPFPGPVGDAVGFFSGGSSSPDISTPWSFLNTAIQDITSGFGIGWKAVLTIIGGILLVGVGILLVFRKQEAKVIEAGAVAGA